MYILRYACSEMSYAFNYCIMYDKVTFIYGNKYYDPISEKLLSILRL